MKIAVSVVAIALVLVMLLTLTGKAQQGGLEWGREYIDHPDSVVFVGGASQYQTITAGVAACPSGGTVFIWPGTYTDALGTNAKSLTFIGDGSSRERIVWQPASTFVVTSDSLTFENLTIITTFIDSALETASNAKLRFRNCHLKMRWVSFYDSTIFEDGTTLEPTAADSFIIKGVTEISNCQQRGLEIQFNRGATGRVIFSQFYSTTGDNVNINGVLAQPFNLEFINNSFKTTAYQCLAASGIGTLKLIGNQFINTDTLKYTVHLSDSLELTVLNNQFDNLFTRTLADQRINALAVLNADTMRFGDNHGSGHALIDTSAEANAADPRIYWMGENSFWSMALFDGVNGTEIPSFVIGMGNDSRFSFEEMFTFDTDSGGLNTCQAEVNDGVFRHTMMGTETSSYYSTKGRARLMGDSCWVAVGDSTSGARVSKLARIYIFTDAFNGTDTGDTTSFTIAGAAPGDICLYQPISTTLSSNDLGRSKIGPSGEIITTRLGAGTSGLSYVVFYIKYSNTWP